MGSSASSPAGGGGASSSSSSIPAPSSGRNANSTSGGLASNSSRRRSSGTSNSAAGRTGTTANPTSTSTNSPTHRAGTVTGSTGPTVGPGTGTGVTTGSSNNNSGSPSRVQGPNGNANAQLAAGNTTTRRSSGGSPSSSGAVTVSGNGSRVVGGVMRPLPSSMSRNRTAGSEFSAGGGGNNNNPTAIPSIGGGGVVSAPHLSLSSPYQLSHRSATITMNPAGLTSGKTLDNELIIPIPDPPSTSSGEGGGVGGGGGGTGAGVVAAAATGSVCLNPASEVNSRLDTQVEIKVYPCNNSHGKKKFTQFMVKPEGVIIQGTNRPPSQDIGTEYSRHIGRKLPRYELSDTRASQLLITSHHKSYYVVPAPEAFSRHSGTCRLLGDRKHTPTNHSLKVGDFLRVGSVGVVVIETHNGVRQDVMSEDRIQKIMQDTTVGGYVDMDGETDVDESSDVETAGAFAQKGRSPRLGSGGITHEYEVPTCYMCFDETDSDTNPLISPCKCKGDTQFVHVECLRKWHTAEADNLICFLSTVDATCSVCKSSFKSDFKLKSGQLVKLFQSSLEPPYVSLLIATKHEMAQRLFNTRFQLSFHTLLKPDGRNATRPLLLGRSSGSDMVLDYRTVSARHASIKFKNGDFIFSDAGSSNGSYLYVRQPVELSANGPSVQFRLGRSMISMKVVNKWNKRLLRAVVRRSAGGNSSGGGSSNFPSLSFGGGGGGGADGGNDGGGAAGAGSGDRGRLNARENILKSLPPLGMLSQQSAQHLDLIYALAIPKRDAIASTLKRGASSGMTNGEEATVQVEQGLEQEEEKLEVSEQEDAPVVVESVSQEMTTSDDGPVVVDESTDLASVEEQGEEQNNDVDTELGSSPPAEEPVVVASSVEVEEDKQEQDDDVEEADDDNSGVEEEQEDAVAVDDVSDDREETTEQDAVGSSDEVDLVMANLSIS